MILLKGGGRAWLLPGGSVRGCSGGHAWLLPGACVVVPGGRAWLLPGGCVFFARGVCVVFARGGMHGFSRGVCMVFPRGVCGFCQGGHSWFFRGGGVDGFSPGGMRGFSRGGGVCVGYDEIRSMSGRYASYWNAFLFCKCYCIILKIYCNISFWEDMLRNLSSLGYKQNFNGDEIRRHWIDNF